MIKNESYKKEVTHLLLGFTLARVDLHTPKMLIIQFHTSSVWENACHTIFIQFLKMVENWYKLISVAVLF